MDSRNAVLKVYSVLEGGCRRIIGKTCMWTGKRKIHSWWDEEVKEAIKRRKHAESIENAGISMNAVQTW